MWQSRGNDEAQFMVSEAQREVCVMKGLIEFKVGGRQLRWKSRDLKWNGGLRQKGNIGGLIRGRAECQL